MGAALRCDRDRKPQVLPAPCGPEAGGCVPGRRRRSHDAGRATAELSDEELTRAPGSALEREAATADGVAIDLAAALNEREPTATQPVDPGAAACGCRLACRASAQDVQASVDHRSQIAAAARERRQLHPPLDSGDQVDPVDPACGTARGVDRGWAPVRGAPDARGADAGAAGQGTSDPCRPVSAARSDRRRNGRPRRARLRRRLTNRPRARPRPRSGRHAPRRPTRPRRRCRPRRQTRGARGRRYPKGEGKLLQIPAAVSPVACWTAIRCAPQLSQRHPTTPSAPCRAPGVPHRGNRSTGPEFDRLAVLAQSGTELSGLSARERFVSQRGSPVRL